MSIRTYENIENLREIETSRNLDEINEFAKKGFFPLIKEVKENFVIHRKYAVFQNKSTGEIMKLGDYRSVYRLDLSDFTLVIPWTRYYPYKHELPFAAYIIPKDIKVGERVYLKDLIEDLIESRWNQGDVYRLQSCIAVWNGEDFEFEYNEETDVTNFIG